MIKSQNNLTALKESNQQLPEKPMVSICCTTFQQALYIKDAIEGFLMQKTNFPVEIIIRDDASKDGAAEIIADYAAKFPNIIRFVLEKENTWSKGVRPMVTCMSYAQGKYIAICEGDDYWTDPYKLQKQADFMEANPEISLCFHKINYYNSSTKEIEKVYPNDLQKTVFTQEDVAKENFIPTLSVLFKNYRNEIPAVPGYKIGDYPLYLFLSSKGQVKFLDFVGATYRFGVGNFSSLNKLNQLRNVKDTLDVVLQQPFLSPASKRILNWQRINYGARIGKQANNNGKYIKLLKGEKEFTNYRLDERILILLKILLKK